MIDCFIVSKDRACQLAGTLQSLYDNTQELIENVYILWKTSNLNFWNGYLFLQQYAKKWLPNKQNPGKGFNIFWNTELDFSKDFLRILESIPKDKILLLTDDTYFFREFKASADTIHKLMDPNILCLSLRLGNNVAIQDCSNGDPMPPIPWTQKYRTPTETFLYWNHHTSSIQYNIGYPISFDGIIYRKDVFLDVCKKAEFKNLRELEGNTVFDVHDNHELHEMMCPEQSCCVNITMNMVQHPFTARCGPYGMTAEDLNDRFLKGEVIDLGETFRNQNIVGSHQLLALKFKKD